MPACSFEIIGEHLYFRSELTLEIQTAIAICFWAVEFHSLKYSRLILAFQFS